MHRTCILNKIFKLNGISLIYKLILACNHFFFYNANVCRPKTLNWNLVPFCISIFYSEITQNYFRSFEMKSLRTFSDHFIWNWSTTNSIIMVPRIVVDFFFIYFMDNQVTTSSPPPPPPRFTSSIHCSCYRRILRITVGVPWSRDQTHISNTFTDVSISPFPLWLCILSFILRGKEKKNDLLNLCFPCNWTRCRILNSHNLRFCCYVFHFGR